MPSGMTSSRSVFIVIQMSHLLCFGSRGLLRKTPPVAPSVVAIARTNSDCFKVEVTTPGAL